MTEEEFDKLARKDFERHLKSVLATVEGRHVFWGMLEEAGIYRSSFSPVDDRHTSYQEGRRSMGLFMLREILTSDPGSFTMMQMEDAERKARKQNLISRDITAEGEDDV